MKKQILSLGLCAAIFTAPVTAHTLKRHQSIDEITTIAQDTQNAQKMIIVIPLSPIFNVDQKILQEAFEELQTQITKIAETEKDQKKLKEKFEKIGQAFTEKVVKAISVTNPELTKTIKQLYDIKDIKIIFVSDLPPTVAPVLVTYLAECGIDTNARALLKEDMLLQSNVKGQAALCGVHMGGIIFVGDMKDVKTAISAALKQAKTKTTYTVHMLDS